jgi:hypothetical protein|nr:MAG TPA: hypothetical protein [Caudoviricetes sp.]
MNYKELIIVAWVKRNKDGYYEIRPIDINGRHLAHKKLPLSICKKHKLVTRINRVNKLQQFLNTIEGHDFFDTYAVEFTY